MRFVQEIVDVSRLLIEERSGSPFNQSSPIKHQQFPGQALANSAAVAASSMCFCTSLLRIDRTLRNDLASR